MPEPTLSSAAQDESGRPPAEDDALAPTVILPPQGGPAAHAATAAVAATAAAAATAEQPQQLTPAAPAAPALASWFGKLPFLGDFASRRLPEAFIRPWDDWLQPGLAAARDATGDRWLDLYLTFPVWRFLVPAGLIGDANWIGVLLPSVDRVGRCFPLTICEAVPRGVLEEAGLIGIDVRLAALANAGIEALDAESVDFLEQRLAGLGTLRANAEPGARPAAPSIPLEAWLQRPRAGQDAAAAAWPLAGSVPAVLATAASRFVVAALRDRVLWWSPADDAGSGALLLEPFPFSSRLLGRLIGTS